jgi:LuxR family transcriptional regulator, maltose regulon positive regulatory protein
VHRTIPRVKGGWLYQSPAGAEATAAQAGPLLRTKIYRPRTNGSVMAPARLLERLNAGLSSKVTLLSAPTGFGKTTLLVEWLEMTERQAVWLTLDEHDNELPVFAHALTAALHTVFPDACPATASLLKASQFPPPERVTSLLINELADLPADVILVLDKYERIQQPEVHTMLKLLITYLPPQVHLVLATRADPPLPLAHWRAQGQLDELRGPDLRFTREETHAFLARLLGNDLARQAAGPLQERTEGWIALVRLAALSLRSASDPAAFLERLCSQLDSSMSKYLLEEILLQQAPAVQVLLIRTAMLEQFCAQLCLATLGNELSSEQMQTSLDWLESTHVFLVPLDERQGWYRLHHLFKQVLEQRLQEHMSQEEISALHRRVSAWFAEQGLLEEAILHALAAGDALGAAGLVEAHFLWAFEQEQWVQLERWLGLVPESQLQGRPSLLVARAWTLQARGQLQALPPLLRSAEQLLATSDSSASDLDDPQSRILRALIAIGWSHFQCFTGQAQASLESARSALRWLGAGEGYVASYARIFLALAQQASGQEDGALAALQQALRDQGASRTETARLLFTQALVYVVAGKLHQAEQTARHLLRLAQEADLALSHCWAHWLLGYVHYEWNQLDAAVYHFSAVVANPHQAHFWAVRDARCGLALAYHAQGLDTRAQETVRALLEFTQQQHNLPELLTGYAFCGQLALLQNEVEAAEHWLELAGEQEVLGPMMFLEDPAITKVRLLLAKGDEGSVAHGQALLSHLLQHVQAIHSTRKTIQVLALQAWAYKLQDRETEALEVLEHALALGRPAGFLRTIADVPPLAILLQEVRKRSKARQTLDRELDASLHHILAAMRPVGSPAGSTQDPLRQEGIEPLTGRERQILRLLDKNLMNKEIARELGLAPGTVKVHTTNIYRKLSVGNRRRAVTLAKALGLLAAD